MKKKVKKKVRISPKEKTALPDLSFLKAKGCEHEEDWEFVCDECGDNFCNECFGANKCLNCE